MKPPIDPRVLLEYDDGPRVARASNAVPLHRRLEAVLTTYHEVDAGSERNRNADVAELVQRLTVTLTSPP